MRPEDIFFDAVTNIREDLIEEAQRYVFRRRGRWRRYAGLAAACLALALGLNLLSQFGGMGGSGDAGGAASGNAAPAPGCAPDQPAVSGTPEGEHSLIADVLEIDGSGSLVVVPQPGSGIWSVADRVTVPAEGVWDMPDVQPGDRILIVYTGDAGEDFVEGVTEIRVLD